MRGVVIFEMACVVCNNLLNKIILLELEECHLNVNSLSGDFLRDASG